MLMWIIYMFLALGAAWGAEQEAVCDQEDLELCTHKFQRLEILDDVFNGTELCEVRIETRNCFVNYTRFCVDGEGEEIIEQEYVEGLESNITKECTSFTGSDEVSRTFNCLGYVENHAEDCALEVGLVMYLDVSNMSETSRPTENQMKCMAMDGIMNCLVSRVRQCSSEEIADAVREGIREELSEIIQACERGEDITPLLESEP